MSQILQVTPGDGTLFFSPHPDDESLAGGGLLPKAVKAGARIHVVYLTNGERNPWPQRVAYRRLLIDAETRRQWAVRRRAESMRALAILGVSNPAAVTFLDWPDQGVTSLLMGADRKAIATIRSLIAAMEPTMVFAPAGEDVHPDHNAFSVILQLALDEGRRAGAAVPAVFRYVVHKPRTPIAHSSAEVHLTRTEVATKAGAIRAHESQMLSSRRLLASAVSVEEFFPGSLPLSGPGHHPVLGGTWSPTAVTLQLREPRRFLRFGRYSLLLALETHTGESIRRAVSLRFRFAGVRVIDTCSGRKAPAATSRVVRGVTSVSIPMDLAHPPRRLFAKLDCRPLFFDVAGWCEPSMTT